MHQKTRFDHMPPSKTSCSPEIQKAISLGNSSTKGNLNISFSFLPVLNVSKRRKIGTPINVLTSRIVRFSA